MTAGPEIAGRTSFAIATPSGHGVPRARQHPGSGFNVGQGIAGVSPKPAFGRFPGPRWPHDRHCRAGDCGSASGIPAPPQTARRADLHGGGARGVRRRGGPPVLARPERQTGDPGPRLEHGGRALLRLRPGGRRRSTPSSRACRRRRPSSPATSRAFYDQLKATPIPEGSWLILQDLEGQVANTLRPFGDAASQAYGISQLSRSSLTASASAAGRCRAAMFGLVKPGRRHRAQPSDRRP